MSRRIKMLRQVNERLFLYFMVSITWHTKNIPRKQPFWHMYLVIPCAHGI